MVRLPALPDRVALLGERGDALGRVLRLRVHREHPLQVVERAVGVHLEHPVEGVATPAQDERRLRGERRRELVDRDIELVDGHDAVHEAHAQPFLRAHPPAGHLQLEHGLRRHRAQHRHGDHVRPQPDVDLGGAELRIVRRDDDVAREREAEPAGEGEAAYPGDDRLAEVPHLSEQVRQQAPAVVRGRRAGVVGDAAEIGPCAERLVARTGEHDHPDRVVRFRAGHGVPQALHDAVRHGVAAFGPVDGDAGDAAVDRVEHLGVRRRRHGRGA